MGRLFQMDALPDGSPLDVVGRGLQKALFAQSKSEARSVLAGQCAASAIAYMIVPTCSQLAEATGLEYSLKRRAIGRGRWPDRIAAGLPVASITSTATRREPGQTIKALLCPPIDRNDLVASKFASMQGRLAAISYSDGHMLLKDKRLKKFQDGQVEGALDKKAMQQMFDEFDINHDGQLDREELRVALSSLGLPCSAEYVADLVLQYDQDRDGAISFKEFAEYVRRKTYQMADAFMELSGGEGKITDENLLRALRTMGLPAGRADAQRMISLLDRNSDSEVSFQEFRRFVCMLPVAQLNNRNALQCWVDTADFCESLEYRLCMTPPKQPYQRLIAGAVAGAVSRTIVAPLERLRTIMMTSSCSIPWRQVVAEMWADGGVAGLFKGNMATVIKVLPSCAVQFAAYDGIKDLLKAAFHLPPDQELNGPGKVLAGAFAGAASTIITYPLETVRTLMSVPGGSANVVAASKQLLRDRGVAAFYRGFGSAVWNDMVGSAIGFLAYESFNKAFRQSLHREPRPAEKGMLGACSAFMVMTFTMPFEVVMRRMQVQALPGRSVMYSGTLDCFSQILKQEGPAAFYRGTLFSYAKVVPSIGAMYCIYELCSKRMAIGGIRLYRRDSQELAAFRARKGGRSRHGSPALAA